MKGYALVALAMVSGLSYATNLVTNGSFEYGDYVANPDSNWMTLGTGSTAMYGWLVTNGEIDWHDPVQFGRKDDTGTYAGTKDGFFCVDMNDIATIEQEITGLQAGMYKVSFWMIAPTLGEDENRWWKEIELQASFGDKEVSFTKETHEFHQSPENWQQFSFYANVEDTSSVLRFHTLKGDLWGPVIDDVRVEAVPEPATLLALSPALFLLMRRRKR